jgi:hypothetical protein
MFFQRGSFTGIVAGKTFTKKLAYEAFIEWGGGECDRE